MASAVTTRQNTPSPCAPPSQKKSSNTYTAPFERAMHERSILSPRGYPMGLFTKIRHPKHISPKIEVIWHSLQNLSEKDARDKIVDLFATRTPHNHSFVSYLYDQLITSHTPQHKTWNFYYKKGLVFYTGTLYRGDNRPPAVIYEVGFALNHKVESRESCIKSITGDQSQGISTTKDRMQAKAYGDYIYEISYFGVCGIDILGSADMRGTTLVNCSFALGSDRRKLQEVKVLHSIPAYCIKGHYEPNKADEFGIRDKELKKLIPNPDYNDVRAQALSQKNEYKISQIFSEKG